MKSRRDFLQKLGISALALHLAAIPGWANGEDPPVQASRLNPNVSQRPADVTK